MATLWMQFLACAVCIFLAGARLSRYGDIIAAHTGLSRSWIGLILVAAATSLPELVSGISATAFVAAPDIAVANVFGSCMLNLCMLALIDLLHRPASLWQCADPGHALAASLGIVTTGSAGLAILLGQIGLPPLLGHVGVESLAMALLYIAAVRALYAQEAARPAAQHEPPPELSLRAAAARYAAAAAVIVAAGIWLPAIAARLAAATGWHDSFVGSLFVAGATTLPELAVTLAALRMGALDIALGNLLGSNLFNLALLAVDDLVYLHGSIWAAVTPLHTFSALSVTTMSGLALAGLAARPQARIARSVGPVSVGLLAGFGLNAWVLWHAAGVFG